MIAPSRVFCIVDDSYEKDGLTFKRFTMHPTTMERMEYDAPKINWEKIDLRYIGRMLPDGNKAKG